MNSFHVNRNLSYPVLVGEKVELVSANTGQVNVRIDQRRYDAMRTALLEVVPQSPDGVAYGELSELVKPHLPKWWFEKEFSIAWHIATVKLDLQHRGLVENVEGKRPMHVRRRGQS